jgi:uncharacterized protein YjcR
MLNDDARRCTATTRDGERCRNPAVTGFDVCRMHGANPESAGGPPEGNENAVTHGGYAKPHLGRAARVKYMLRRQNELQAALGQARSQGDRRRVARLHRLLVTNDNLMTRMHGRLRRSLPV